MVVEAWSKQPLNCIPDFKSLDLNMKGNERSLAWPIRPCYRKVVVAMRDQRRSLLHRSGLDGKHLITRALLVELSSLINAWTLSF